jgi:glycosyltransferase involved in cell wall biosynthesis
VNALRLAVDARDLASDTRGIGRYTRAILRRLAERDDIDLTLLVFGPLPYRNRAKMQATLGTDRFRLSSRAGRCDVLWHPGNGTFFSARAPNVVTIHDAVPFRFPHPDARKREQQQAPFLRSVQTAARIVAVSLFDKAELMEVFTLPADRITVVYHGVDRFFSPGPADLDAYGANVRRPYFLFVGDPLAERRKNFPLLYQAHRLAFNGMGPPLVVVGQTDPKLDDVHYAGLLGDDAAGQGDARLRAYYRGALALCIPSYHETFGMPMVEAMACGTPVIASDASCLPEIGGDAARFVPPDDSQAWSIALRELAHDATLRERFGRLGLQRAQRYDWDECAQQHAEVFFGL